MADGSCTGGAVTTTTEVDVVEEAAAPQECFFRDSESGRLFKQLGLRGGAEAQGRRPGALNDPFRANVAETAVVQVASDDDCPKKRCADRYDSSESSDSGVAVLSCSDSSGSSTASSDLTDPGSPFSTTSSHSDDSSTQPQLTVTAKMPPTPTSPTHHSWHWSTSTTATTPQTAKIPSKRLKRDDATTTAHLPGSSPPSTCHPPNIQVYANKAKMVALPGMKTTTAGFVKVCAASTQQGKITEYFKAQMKANGIKKEFTKNNNFFPLVDEKTTPIRRVVRKTLETTKVRKISSVTIPRKILPAPTKCDKVINNNNNNGVNALGGGVATPFPPTVTLTTLLPPNLAYLHAKAPKTVDNFLMQPYAPIHSDKLNAIPLVNTMLHPMPKIATINNFNCIKLNAHVVPIVKLNTMPTKASGTPFGGGNVPLNLEAGLPTVMPAKAKTFEPQFHPPQIHHQQHQQQQLQQIPHILPHPPSPAPTIVTLATTPPNQQQHQQDAIVPEKKVLEPDPLHLDSDSGVSSVASASKENQLEVCVAEVVSAQVAEPPLRSPILSQPKTIRFPARPRHELHLEAQRSAVPEPKEPLDTVNCRWAECQAQFDTNGALLEHLQVKHVISQATEEQYVCLWLGCKVHGRTSCSRTWLERHVLAHAGTKPFRCIVEGCGVRYNSQLALERHVNGHFNSDGSQNTSAKKSVENGSVKLYKRNGKRIRFRRQPWSARMFDFFDGGVMEELQHRLLTMTERRTKSQIEGVPGDTVVLHSQVLARRVESDGTKKLLLRWQPDDVLPDEWVNELDYSKSRQVSIPSLHPSAINSLHPELFISPSSTTTSASTQRTPHQKHRRKPLKKPPTT